MQKTKTILLADDSQTTLTMHRMILAGAGYELLTARDGQEAVEVAMARRPDLILMDLMMPVLNGFETIRMLRRDPATRAIPVIICSAALASLAFAREKLAMLDVAVLEKPFDLEQLTASVAAALASAPRSPEQWTRR